MTRAPSNHRLKPRHHAGAWIGAIRRAIGPGTREVEHMLFETSPPHYLIALWKPLRLGQPLLPRWPRKAQLVAPDPAAALAELLREVPETESLWLTEQSIDWGLVADIVMQSEPQLGSHQRDELERFIREEREATLAAIRSNYRGSVDEPLGEMPLLLDGRGRPV